MCLAKGFCFSNRYLILWERVLVKLFLFPGSKSFGRYSFKVAQKKESGFSNEDFLVKACLFFTLSFIPSLALALPLPSFTLLLSHPLTPCAHVCVCVRTRMHMPFHSLTFFFFCQESQVSVNYCIALSHSSSPVSSSRQFGANWIVSEQLLSPQEQEKVQEIKIKISQPCSTAN